MAPLKPLNKHSSLHPLPVGIKTRSQVSVTMKKDVFPKRKADGSPLKRSTVKRSAFGDLTNAHSKENAIEQKIKTSLKKTVMGALKPLTLQNTSKVINATVKVKEITKHPKPLIVPTVKKKTTQTTVAVIESKTTLIQKAKPPTTSKIVPVKEKEKENTIRSGPVTRSSLGRSSDVEKSDASLYVSALEALELDDKDQKKPQPAPKPKVEKVPPPGVDDFDKEMIDDLHSNAVYAMDVFEYLKSREKKFKVLDYMDKQLEITKPMRSLLVDWMVEVQENFELNHETLYLAVKIVDLYLSKISVRKETLQLVGCAGLFIACKYDERIPPLIEDFLYVCDDLYSAEELMKMEIKVLKTLDFNLGIPLSYRFLRRYARCAKIQMPLLTLARFILEYSLMDYSMSHYSDSKLAAAALLLALIMKNEGKWTPTLEYYSGYKVDDFKDIVYALNEMIHKKPKEVLKTIRNKYSHKLFYEVALTPLVDDLDL